MPRFIKDDPAVLAEYITEVGRGLIALDGRPGVGKTPLAKDIANRVGGTAVDADMFLQPQMGKFVGALRIEEMRHAIEAGGPLVLLSSVCARRVVEQLKMTATAFVWVEWASLVRLDQMCRDFFEYDEGAEVPSKHPLYKEVQAYIDTSDARRWPDVIYMNAYGDRKGR
jgi:hypothetical protein